MKAPPELAALVAGAINLHVITDHWSELLRLATSIKTGTVTASVILRKLAAYPRQNGLALALRELGKLGGHCLRCNGCRTPNCVVAATSVSTNENQRHRASGLNLLVAAIILWNTTYLQRAVDHLRKQGHHPAPGDLGHLSPLGWEHINLG